MIEDEIGNQFVWIPHKIYEDLSKDKVIEDFVSGPLGSKNKKEYLQIVNYEGFYVSRYEIGLPESIQKNAQLMYNNENIESDLITFGQYEHIQGWLQECQKNVSICQKQKQRSRKYVAFNRRFGEK